MQKITFENYPSTNTPVSADNLNLLQTNVENGISDLVNVVSSGAATGNVKIGNIGIEWGTVSVTPSSGSNPYYGSTTVNFQNTYAFAPSMTANLGAGYTSVTNVATISVSTTSGNVWLNATANAARNCRYLVIGVLAEESEGE